jgi:hypothetical protein
MKTNPSPTDYVRYGAIPAGYDTGAGADSAKLSNLNAISAKKKHALILEQEVLSFEKQVLEMDSFVYNLFKKNLSTFSPNTFASILDDNLINNPNKLFAFRQLTIEQESRAGFENEIFKSIDDENFLQIFIPQYLVALEKRMIDSLTFKTTELDELRDLAKESFGHIITVSLFQESFEKTLQV